jgi:hypothetical protein
VRVCGGDGAGGEGGGGEGGGGDGAREGVEVETAEEVMVEAVRGWRRRWR